MATGPTLVFGQLTFPLNKETNSVGRKDRITNLVPDVDLVTLDQERSVSRKHAEVVYDHGTMALRDVGSTNGTTVNGGRLSHQVDRTLEDGDRVGFGGVDMVFAAMGEWPEGVEAEWPPEVPEALAEETMVAGPLSAEETMVAGPLSTEETMVAPPSDFSSSETMVFAPSNAPAGEAEAVPAWAPEEPPAAEAEPLPEPRLTPDPVYAEPVVEAYVACSNHPHLPAIGVCPGCLESFCVDCLPEREDGLMVCNRCAGISYRLGSASAAAPPAAQVAAPFEGMPSGAAFPDPAPLATMPQPAPPPVDGEKKEKKWPF
jgi:predicted component of type VI protein secretion system